MQLIDRNNISDAKKCINSFFSHLGGKNEILLFLSDKIEYANNLDSDNWNLNLDLNRKFLRFNAGQEYCIQITNSECLVLCLRQFLPKNLDNSEDIKYRGYDGKVIIQSHNIKDVPDCLIKVPDSIGCVIQNNFNEWLPILTNSNIKFIEYAIKNTRILPKMIAAHSVGAVDFISEFTKKNLSNPSFAFYSVQENESIFLKKLKKLSSYDLIKLASSKEKFPQRSTTKINTFSRNPYIGELAKRLANGICQDCRQPAPFINKLTDQPYLEVHHIQPLSEGGEDSIDNVVALCPNCHRQRHYG